MSARMRSLTASASANRVLLKPVSYTHLRNHNEFHEQCVERMFMDIWTRCKPVKLTVYARYTRRGGLDISPFRTSHPQSVPLNVRTARQ